MKTVFLYAGQGSQKVGMGKDLYEEFPTYRKWLDQLHLPAGCRTMMEEGPIEQLSMTENTQPCMSAFAVGVTEVLKENGILPDAACGLSLGEYGALFSAGVFSAEDYVKITAFRGRVMADAAQGCTCSMSAVLGLTTAEVTAVCKECESEGFLTVANYNCPGQYVICGDELVVAAAEVALKNAGAAKCIKLKVSGPFHTKYMKPAAQALGQMLKEINFETPVIPVVLNVTGDFWQEGDDLKAILEQQVQSSVHFEESLTKLMNAGAENFVEIGPGKVLSGFVKKTAKALGKEVTCMAIDNAEDLKKVLESKEELIHG